MATSRPITDLLTRDEIAALTRPSDLRGALSVLWSWGVIAAALALAGAWPAWWTAVLAVLVIGGQQLGLAVLMHECSHRSLFASRRANDLVGEWLCGAPVWGKLAAYRKHHMRHHNHTGTPEDPDIGLAAPFPCGRPALARKLLRDLTGIAGLKRVAALALMDMGLLSYSVSDTAAWIPRGDRSWPRVLVDGLRAAAPTLLTNAALAGVLTLAGIGWTWWLWLAAFLTTFSLVIRIRSIAEHGATDETDDLWRNTRTTHANPLARLLLAPHQVNYHLEHHLLMTVPHYHLPAMRRLLASRDALAGTAYEPGYLAVMRRAAASPSGSASPG